MTLEELCFNLKDLALSWPWDRSQLLSGAEKTIKPSDFQNMTKNISESPVVKQNIGNRFQIMDESQKSWEWNLNMLRWITERKNDKEKEINFSNGQGPPADQILKMDKLFQNTCEIKNNFQSCVDMLRDANRQAVTENLNEDRGIH